MKFDEKSEQVKETSCVYLKHAVKMCFRLKAMRTLTDLMGTKWLREWGCTVEETNKIKRVEFKEDAIGWINSRTHQKKEERER